jgi:hypothetical protein
MEPRNEALSRVIARATTDPEFRRRLLIDPRPAIQEECGITIPADFRIRFIERGTDVDALIVLPDFESGEPPEPRNHKS